MKKTDPLVFFRPDLFPVGDELDALATGTLLRFEMEEYLLHHDADLQDKVDQLIGDALVGTDVRKQLKKKRAGRPGHSTARALALATEHARLAMDGHKAKATRLIVAKLKELKMGVDDEALRKEINRAVEVFKSAPSQVEKYESKLKALNLL